MFNEAVFFNARFRFCWEPYQPGYGIEMNGLVSWLFFTSRAKYKRFTTHGSRLTDREIELIATNETAQFPQWAVVIFEPSTSAHCPRQSVQGSLFLDSTRRNVDPTRSAIADKTSDPTRPNPPYMYYVSWVQNSSCREQYTTVAWFRGKQWKIFVWFCKVSCMRVKKSKSNGPSFQDRGLDAKKTANIRCYIKCIRALIRAGPNSEVWTIFIL